MVESTMDESTRRLIAYGAILAPALHTLTDGLEWAQHGFSPVQLWINYLAFLPLPAVMLGLHAAQRPRISRLGLAGALIYGFAFVYLAGIALNLVLGFLPVPDLLQTMGTTVRNAGLIGMGWALAR
jgi:hypothetical protein